MDDATRCKIARGVARRVLRRVDLDAEHLAEQTARTVDDPRHISTAVRRRLANLLRDRRVVAPTEPIHEYADLPDRGEYAALAREAVECVPESDRGIARRIVEDFEGDSTIARAIGGNYRASVARVRRVREQLQEAYSHG